MSGTTKTNWLVLAVIALAVINLAALGYIWFNKPEAVKGEVTGPRNGDARAVLIRELALDTVQVKQFDSLRKMHFDVIGGYRASTRELKDALFSRLHAPADSSVQFLAQQIGRLQEKMDLETFDHFSRLRALLRPQQVKKFDEVIQDILRNMGGPPGRRGEGPPPEGPEGRRGSPPTDGPPQ